MTNTIRKKLDTLAMRDLKRFGERVNRLGADFAVCNSDGELVLLCNGNCGRAVEEGDVSGNKRLIEYSQKVLGQDGGKRCADSKDNVCRIGEGNQVLGVVLKSGPDTTDFAALIDAGDNKQGEYLGDMLSLLAENFQVKVKAEEQIEMVSAELAQTYEELVLLHNLGANMKVTESDANFLQMACDRLTDIVSVEGIAILLEKTVEDEKRSVLTAGSGLIDIDEHLSAVLFSRVTEELRAGKEALLDSEVDSPFKYDWPANIKNIIAVPLCGKDKSGASFGSDSILHKDHKKQISESGHGGNSIIGLMVAINRIDKPDFDSIDVKLFNSVANGCAVFIENGRLFRDLKDLFIGSLKALTNSIDAKDPYTRGHSERVAFISRWIAERLAEEEPFEEEQIHRLYLAGLLHDIGKMGISEAVLRKKEKLTREEFEHIRTHPSVGAGILSGIKQMRDIVPGVLSLSALRPVINDRFCLHAHLAAEITVIHKSDLLNSNQSVYPLQRFIKPEHIF